MADNVAFQSATLASPASGTKAKTEETSTDVHVQEVKLYRQAKTTGSPTSVTVGVASAEAVAANADRASIYLRNLFTNTDRISIAFGAAAVLDDGITLWPGESWQMENHTWSGGNVRAISGTAGQEMAVQEWTR